MMRNSLIGETAFSSMVRSIPVGNLCADAGVKSDLIEPVQGTGVHGAFPTAIIDFGAGDAGQESFSVQVSFG